MECRCLIYGMQQYATKYNGMWTPNSEYRGRKNGMLRNDLQTD